MSSLRWLYDKHIKPLEEGDGITFDLLHQSMLKAKWEHFDTLGKNKAAEFLPPSSETKKNFYRELLGMNEDILASCGFTFEQFYAKVESERRGLPKTGGILLDPTYSKILLIKGAVHGTYGFPRCRIDPGESACEAALKNIKIRTGYSALLDDTTPLEITVQNRERYSITLFYVREVPVDFDFSTCNDAEIEFFDLDKIRIDRYYGTTGKRVTHLVQQCLREIKHFAMFRQK